MGLTTGRRPVKTGIYIDYWTFTGSGDGNKALKPKPSTPIGITNYRWVKTNNGFEFQEMGVRPTPPPAGPPTKNYSCPYYPDRQIGHSNFCQCYSMKKGPQELTCKEQFCKLKFMGVPGTEFCSFDCQVWHESLCK